MNSKPGKAKNFISGGNIFFKKTDVFLPNNGYFKKQKDKIQSLSKKEYLDFSIMGIGTNILGYANKEVDNAVTNAVKNGNMSTLNCC